MEVSEKVVTKWSWLIGIAKKYWIDSEPTGLSDEQFNIYEAEAARDGLFVRDYVMSLYLKGTRTRNHYIEKISKFKVPSNMTMLDAIKRSSEELGISPWCTLKYDGSSLAIYLDPSTGKPKRVVTVGNLNINDYGVDQSWKLINLLPKRFPKGIVAIQAEALLDISHCGIIGPDRARQKANGLINSKNCDYEVATLLTLRAYRYYTEDSIYGKEIKAKSYRDVLNSFETVRSKVDGHVLFAPAQVWSIEELDRVPEFTETDHTVTRDGTFLNDGWVLYNDQGVCIRALKYSGAGNSTEAIKTKVKGILWNDQSSKGKDSWSANVIIDPVVIRGCTVTKPSAGSISKLIKNKITPGATVGIILANSTIPMVSEVYEGGQDTLQFPVCGCGYTLGPQDTYGSLLKCGNPYCTVRLNRMKNYLEECKGDIDLNKLLVIDRWKWENTNVDLSQIKALLECNKPEEYHDYLLGFLKTDLQKRNLELVWRASWKALLDYYEGL